MTEGRDAADDDEGACLCRAVISIGTARDWVMQRMYRFVFRRPGRVCESKILARPVLRFCQLSVPSRLSSYPSSFPPFLPSSPRFAIYLQEKEESEQRPVFTEDGYTFAYLKYNNLFLLSVTKRNSNVALMLVYLSRLVDVFKEYFGELEEESIRDNFVIIYELMDETMDFGYPQTTEAKILREYITQEGNRLEAAPRPPVALTNTVSWRSEGIKHRKNEIFLDVIEKLNLLVSANGTVLHSEIVGAIRMKSFLSGMPELKLGLNDKLMFEAAGRSVSASTKGKAIELEDIKFHQCVRLARFENDRTISFIPPDGEFDLMTYRLSTQVKPLIWVEAVVEPHSHSRIEYMIKVRKKGGRKEGGREGVVVRAHEDGFRFLLLSRPRRS